MDWPTFYVHKSSAGFILHNKLLNPHKFWCLTDCLGVSNLTLSKHCTSRISPSYDIQRSVFRHLGNNWPYSFWNSRVFSLWKRHFRNFLPILSSQALVSLFSHKKQQKQRNTLWQSSAHLPREASRRSELYLMKWIILPPGFLFFVFMEENLKVIYYAI